jgi:hypothetical protein
MPPTAAPPSAPKTAPVCEFGPPHEAKLAAVVTARRRETSLFMAGWNVN